VAYIIVLEFILPFCDVLSVIDTRKIQTKSACIVCDHRRRRRRRRRR
jgi:hypothetical protein